MQEEKQREDHTRGINLENQTISATEIQKYLDGVEYPTKKDNLVQNAQNMDAPQEILATLERLPDDEYGSLQDVMKKFGEHRKQ